jgi:hypothetical protein
MKFRNLLTTAALATTALLSAGTSARATLTYNPGDLFLGFQKTGTATDLLVNIGNISLFSQLNGATFTVNLGGSIGDDLTDTFGASWNTTSTLFWSVSGTTFATLGDLNTIYLTKARGTNVNNQSSPWISNTNNGQGDQVALLQGLAGAYRDNGVATGNSTTATLQSTGLANSYASFTQGTSSDFQWGNIEGRFNNGTAGSVLDLYRVTPSLDSTPATYLGKFTIDNSGIVTYTSAVPEPSTYGFLIGAGLVFLIIIRRRHRALNS